MHNFENILDNYSMIIRKNDNDVVVVDEIQKQLEIFGAIFWLNQFTWIWIFYFLFSKLST